ncbi:MAG: hypothetical protein IJR06_04345 [Paludibacteraceae bacterium]|nr:hypothetical protein [Paludibacteraceae bacterium]
MIQLVKKNGGGRFDLPVNFEIPLELSNPYIEESGDFSLPFSLPVTSTNLSLTEYPVIRSKYSRSGIDIDCLLICGVTQFDGTLSILSVTSEAIEGTFISKSKDLRAILGDKTLEEVFDGVEESFPSGDTPTLDFLRGLIDAYRVGGKPYTVFPILVKNHVVNQLYSKLLSSNVPSITPRSDADAMVLLDAGYDSVYTYTGSGGVQKRGYTDADGRTYGVPRGYCITPYLFVWYVLKRICEFAGYELANADNIFYTDEALQNLVILNNTLDSCCASDVNKLHFKHLVPDITASEFIRELWVSFGVSVVCGSDGSAHTMQWNTLLRSDAVELPGYMQPNDTITLTPLKALKIEDAGYIGESKYTYDCGNNQAVWSDHELKKYGYTYTSSRKSTRYCLLKRLGVNPDVVNPWAAASTPEERESLESKMSRPWFHDWYSYSDASSSVTPAAGQIPYLDKARNKVVNIEYNESDITEDDECPLVFVFYKHRAGNDNRFSNYFRPECRTAALRDASDIGYGIDEVVDLAETTQNNAMYDLALRGGMSEFTVTAVQDISQFHVADFDKVYNYRGVRCIIRKKKITLSDDNLYEVEYTLAAVSPVL